LSFPSPVTQQFDLDAKGGLATFVIRHIGLSMLSGYHKESLNAVYICFTLQKTADNKDKSVSIIGIAIWERKEAVSGARYGFTEQV